MNVLWYKRIPFPRSSIATGMHDLSSHSHGSFHTLTNTVYFRGPTNFKVYSAVIVYMHMDPPSYRKNLPLLKVHVCCDVSFIQNFITIAPYTVYQFRVQAATRVGFGPFSPPREFIMLESGKEYISQEFSVCIF